MRRRGRGRMCVAGTLTSLVTAAALPVGGADRAGAAFPGRDGRIAFHRALFPKKGGLTGRIMTTDRRGRKVKAITPRCCKPGRPRLRLVEEPAWSPDGRRIAFGGGRLRDHRIFTISRRGKKRRQLTTGKRYEDRKFQDQSPSWSPDGTRIAFSRRHGNDQRDLFVVDADGSNLRAIETDEVNELEPAWSPDGEWIAFQAFETATHSTGIYRMRPDGGDQQLVIELRDLRVGLDWSPDGGLLAFSTRAETPTSRLGPEIHTVRPDGSEARRLTKQRRPAHGAAFSPRGDRIVFTVAGVLKVIDADGGKTSRLLRKSRGAGDFAPSWGAR